MVLFVPRNHKLLLLLYVMYVGVNPAAKVLTDEFQFIPFVLVDKLKEPIPETHATHLDPFQAAQ